MAIALNRSTFKALDLDIPPNLEAIAGKVIEG
jgi:hypothetical protein